MRRARIGLLGLLVALGGAGRAPADPLPGAPAFAPELRARLDAALAARGADHDVRSRHRTSDGRPRFINRLILETSPYLLQHAHNPVNWYSWGDAAFADARRLGRPVFLSIGYSTCHWCHVMEEESFDDPEIAEYLNRHYIAVKVDREERPDIDGVYMTAVRILTRGGGGWPLTVWLTPDRDPFYGATYLPPRTGARGAKTGLLELLELLARSFDERRGDIAKQSQSLRVAVENVLAPESSVGVPKAENLRAALASYRARFDAENGGVRGRHKFPSSLPIPFLLRIHRRTGDAGALRMARTTLDAMRRGGLYDHVGGGFHRYTTEPTWTVPHFEKMLYDNAQLISAYTEAHQVTGDPAYAALVRDVADYVARDMTAPLGTFYSATDADSEGEEGRYFVWTRSQLREAVGPALAPLAIAAYGATAKGNFPEGRNVLRRDQTAEELGRLLGQSPEQVERGMKQVRERLRAARARRIPPHRDEKQLVAWNGLMISALARAGMALGEPDWIERASRAARVLLDRARPGGRLARYLADGVPRGNGILDDYAFFEAGLLDLFEASGESAWLEAALWLQAELDRHFADPAGGYWITRDDAEELLAREKPVRDGALPSGNSIAALNLLRLYYLTTDEEYRERAEMALRSFSDILAENPTSMGRMLDALDFLLDTPKEILIVTPADRSDAEPFLRELGRVFLPNRVLVVAPEAEIPALEQKVPLLSRKRALGGRATAYVCENRVCDLPAREPGLFAEQIRKRPAPYSGTGASPSSEEGG